MPFEIKDTPASAGEQQAAREALSLELRLDQLEAKAREILGPETDAWLDAENLNLGGRTPREFLNGGDSEKEVLRELLDNIRYGVFS